MKAQIDEYIYDEIFEDTNDLFFLDADEKSISQHNDSRDSSGDYLTEQAYHNDLESSISITERSSKFLQQIYIELLKIIKPIERPGSYAKTSNRNHDNDIMATSPRGSTLEDELDEDQLFHEVNGQIKTAQAGQ